MDGIACLVELHGRLPERIRSVLDGLGDDDLVWAPADGANTIAWLVWHLTRVQDHHVSELDDVDQLYLADGWHERFGRGPDPQDHGYGHDAADVASVRGTATDLAGYYDAVHARTLAHLRGLDDAALDVVVDERWDPPVTHGVRLASVIDDCLEHAAQAAYVRGLRIR